MKHAAFLLSIVCLLVFVACGQGDKTEKATVSEPVKATEMAKEKAEETTEMVKEKAEETAEMAKEKAEETTEMVKEKAEETAEMVKEKAEETAPKAEQSKSSNVSKKTSKRRYHTVNTGETVYRISLRYGLTVKEIQLLNKLNDSSVIYPGQKLLVSP